MIIADKSHGLIVKSADASAPAYRIEAIDLDAALSGHLGKSHPELFLRVE
jgi:hypothetical protein